jgi:hypothetical protein
MKRRRKRTFVGCAYLVAVIDETRISVINAAEAGGENPGKAHDLTRIDLAVEQPASRSGQCCR